MDNHTHGYEITRRSNEASGTRNDYIGAACLGFWVVIAFGVLFLGWFGIRPRKVFMTDFMHCNCCYVLPSAQTAPKYFLTNCYHLLCQACLQKATGNPVLCPVCNYEMRSIEINSAMDPKLQELFKPPKKLIQEKMAALKRKYDFQQMLVNSLLGHLKKQREKLNQLMKFCQRQTQFTKEQAKEMEELKEWVRTAEIKMKEGENEKISLKKEIEDMKKLSKSELQAAVDKRWDRGAAFLGRDTRANMQGPCVSAQERRAAVPHLVYGCLEFAVA
ncbi:hypothetical protein Y032_0181g856 [Ancylostoma ceylanicum]|uniref:RING-type domain-containing protein n=1 Tax=Ancylostoma ceylanicum TaxID=53326 RepID=A0A016ST67_9BILA|nr:hypothetical protein Y032_0181g856 [Ancylostoma ceylanicum]